MSIFAVSIFPAVPFSINAVLSLRPIFTSSRKHLLFKTEICGSTAVTVILKKKKQTIPLNVTLVTGLKNDCLSKTTGKCTKCFKQRSSLFTEHKLNMQHKPPLIWLSWCEYVSLQYNMIVLHSERRMLYSSVPVPLISKFFSLHLRRLKRKIHINVLPVY